MHLGARDIGQLAAVIFEIAATDPEGDCRLALSFLARNMIAETGLSVRECCRQLRKLEHKAHLCGASAECAELCAVGALMCQVCCGELRDPTKGATAAHRHTDHPPWADRATPTALIGPWIFYRAVLGVSCL